MRNFIEENPNAIATIICFIVVFMIFATCFICDSINKKTYVNGGYSQVQKASSIDYMWQKLPEIQEVHNE